MRLGEFCYTMPMLTKQSIFIAGNSGYALYRIPGLSVTSSGVLIATSEARRGHGGDWDNNDVVMRRSHDGGLTWEETHPVVRQDDYGTGPISNFVMIADQFTGALHALFCHNYARIFYMRSDDDGSSFSHPIDITYAAIPLRQHYPWRIIAAGPGHGLQLRSGRMIVPLWMSDGTGTVLCLYESAGMMRDVNNAAITLARFDINWVTQ